MNYFTTLFAICCLTVTAKARPGYEHQRSSKLEGIPDIRDYSVIMYPKYDLIELGEYSTGHVPGDQIHESKHVTVKVPEPYPVKVPVPQPYPVHIAKPYPVVDTKYIKVPHAVPYEIVKKVVVPIEVPKPYPVQVHDNSGEGDSYHAGSQQCYGIQEYNNELANPGGEGQMVNSYEAQGEEQGFHNQQDQQGQADWQEIQQ